MSTLTLIFALPLLAAIALAFVPRNFAVIMRAVAVGVTFITMLLGILIFFYFFHELALVPTFIMIGVWGRGERKNYATFQITLYLSIGALLALIGLIALYLQLPADARTFDIPTLTKYFTEHTMAHSAQ